MSDEDDVARLNSLVKPHGLPTLNEKMGHGYVRTFYTNHDLHSFNQKQNQAAIKREIEVMKSGNITSLPPYAADKSSLSRDQYPEIENQFKLLEKEVNSIFSLFKDRKLMKMQALSDIIKQTNNGTPFDMVLKDMQDSENYKSLYTGVRSRTEKMLEKILGEVEDDNPNMPME
ncbi:MAG: hypothetical protein ACRCXC_09430 [Legionella sp.]